MPMLMIKCPKTGKPVPTGINMPQESLDSSTLESNTIGRCPACGESHTWGKRDVLPFS